MSLLVIVVYILLALINGLIARSKGLVARSGMWGVVLCSIVFTPIIIFVLMLFFPRRDPIEDVPRAAAGDKAAPKHTTAPKNADTKNTKADASTASRPNVK